MVVNRVLLLLNAGICGINFGVWVGNANAGAFIFALSAIAYILIEIAKED